MYCVWHIYSFIIIIIIIILLLANTSYTRYTKYFKAINNVKMIFFLSIIIWKYLHNTISAQFTTDSIS
jgi:K+-sensing histidine kinase KdpD